MLPSSKEVMRSTWDSFDEAKSAFDSIKPHQTSSEELKTIGFDPHATPNFEILNYLELIQRFMPNPSVLPKDLDAGLRNCLESKEECIGYEVTIRKIDRQRHGNLMLDLFNFRQKTKISGWEFKALLVLQNNLVVYKIWGGKPNISASDSNKNPLGPLQKPASIIKNVL